MLHDEMAMLNGTIGDLEFVMEELNDQLDDKNEELQTKEIVSQNATKTIQPVIIRTFFGRKWTSCNIS